jgi:cell division protein FtsQ
MIVLKNLTLLGKIRSLYGKKEKKESGVSALSRKSNQQCYQEKHLGGAARRKSLREQWQAKREGRRQQRAVPIGGHHTEKQRSPLKLVLLAGIALLGGYLLLVGPMQTLFSNLQYFRIHDIEINGCVVTNSSGLRKFADISYELNMLTLDPKAIKGRLEGHPWVEHAEIRRMWPDRLAVSIREHRALALVVQDGENGFMYLDGKGNLFAAVAPGQELDFPVITGLDAFDTEAEKEQLLAEGTSFLRQAGRNNPNLPAQNVSEIHFNGAGELILYLVDQPFPIYFGKGDVKRKYYQLRKVLEVLYRKKNGRIMIENVAYIRMDYQEDKVLVARRHAV